MRMRTTTELCGGTQMCTNSNWPKLRSAYIDETVTLSMLRSKVELSDPVAEGLPLGLATQGVMVTEHKTEVSFSDTLSPEQREQYEDELRQMLTDKLGNVAEVVFFDHNLRSRSRRLLTRPDSDFQVRVDSRQPELPCLPRAHGLHLRGSCQESRHSSG